MAWETNDITQEIQMTVDDFGVPLPLDFEGMTLTERDRVCFVIVDGSTEIINKVYDNIQNNSINLVITAAETQRLSVGTYLYRLDWYQDNAFMFNLAPHGVFKVDWKAKGEAYT